MPTEYVFRCLGEHHREFDAGNGGSVSVPVGQEHIHTYSTEHVSDTYILNAQDAKGIDAVVENDSGDPLAGVDVGVFDSAGKQVGTTQKYDDNGAVTFTNVPVGDYTVKQLSTVDDYDKATDQKITLTTTTTDKDNNVTLNNTKYLDAALPITGSTGRLILASIVFLLIIISGVAFALKTKRQQQRDLEDLKNIVK